MDLLKLNNEISGMRPFARQSKIHIIHALTKKAEQFSKRFGPEEKKAAYNKKAERCMQEALIDKVLKPDEIIKFSLQFDSSLRDKVLDDISIPLSAKAFARIAAHPSLVEAVNKFREKYPDWNKWLESSLQKLGTGARFNNKMKNGRVKAHLQQRQRVEEAVDTIRRAQMSWLHRSGKDKIKVQSKNIGESTEEQKITSNKKVKDEEPESSDDSTAENNKIKFERNAVVHSKSCNNNDADAQSESSDNSGAESDNDSSTKHAVSCKSKSNRDSQKNKKTNKGNSKDSQKSRIVVYEEVDENDSESDQEVEKGSDQEVEEENDKKFNSAAIKKKLNKKLAQLENKDSDSEESMYESADDSVSEKSFDNESENSAENECEESANKSESNESGSDDKIDEKTAKKLLKKAKKKQKVVLPRSREVEVCKFSDLLKKEQKIIRSNERDDSDDESKPSNSPEKGVDPFFMTRNNDFLRIATAKRDPKPEEPIRKGPKWGIEGSESWTGTRRERRARARRIMGCEPDPEVFHRGRGPPKFNNQSFPIQREKAREPWPSSSVKNVPTDEPEKLHPSWAAKRKLNIASVGFQGKKVKFDDSD